MSMVIYTKYTLYIILIVYTINWILYRVCYIDNFNTIDILYMWYTIYSIICILYDQKYIDKNITYNLPITYTEICWRPQEYPRESWL